MASLALSSVDKPDQTYTKAGHNPVPDSPSIQTLGESESITVKVNLNICLQIYQAITFLKFFFIVSKEHIRLSFYKK